MHGTTNIVDRQGRIVPRQARALAQRVGTILNLGGARGLGFDQNATSAHLVDNRHRQFLAIITGAQGGSGLGGSYPVPANDQSCAYDWVEAQWVTRNDDFVVIEKPDGASGTLDTIPAIEANGAEDVEDGTVVWMYPGFGNPDFYFFFAPDAGASGSGGVNYTITCNDDGTVTVT